MARSGSLPFLLSEICDSLGLRFGLVLGALHFSTLYIHTLSPVSIQTEHSSGFSEALDTLGVSQKKMCR